jgi:CHAD domain-containing protein
MSSSKKFGRELAHYTSKNVRRLNRSFENVLDTRDVEAVHDFRKATRNLQTVIDACAAERTSHRARKLRTRLKDYRHALSDWRDSDVMLVELKNSRRRAHTAAEKRCWSKLTEQTSTRRKKTIKRFLGKSGSLKIKAAGADAKKLVADRIQSESLIGNLRLLLRRCWENWNRSIEDFVRRPGAPELHAVRIKAKTLRYGINLQQRFYPDRRLEHAAEWLKDVQDKVGAWHDESTFAQRALEAFSKTKDPRNEQMVKLIRDIKEKELRMAESTSEFIASLRQRSEYRILHRLLSASVYAMANGRDPYAGALETIEGPIQ